MEQLIGTGVALVTPFKEDLSVDTTALGQIVEHCVDGGENYLVVLGTTGESVELSRMVNQVVEDTVISSNAGRLPLVLGFCDNNTVSLIEEIQQTDLSEFIALLSVSPYYTRPTQEGT